MANTNLVLQKKGNAITLMPNITSAEELMEWAIEEVGFTPKRGDIMAYGTLKDLKLYITKSGYSRLAVIHKISTKMKLVKLERGKIRSATFKCTAVLPDGCFHEEYGYCDSHEPGKGTRKNGSPTPLSNIIGMAETRARNRAINIASKVPAGSFSEMSEEERKNMYDITEMDNESLKTCPICGEIGWSKIQKRCRVCNITHEEIIELKQKEASK